MNLKQILWVTLSSCLITSAMSALLGIDYGQQHIKAMVVSPQAPLELVLTPEAKRKDVAGLAIKKLASGNNKETEIERVYGGSIGSLETRFPQNVALHLKPLLGMTINDTEVIDAYLNKHPGVNITSTNRNTLAFIIDGVTYPVEELLAMNLQEIAHRSNALLKENDHRTRDYVDKFALTVPDFFNQRQRMALIDAASFINKAYGTYLVSDGLSVAINFALKQQRSFDLGKDYQFIIYDMGSGSVKASLFKISNPENVTEPMTIELRGYGFATLGGSDLTAVVSDIIEEKFIEKHGNKKLTNAELKKNSKSLAKINQLAEKMKMVLSANNDASGSIESLINDIDFKVVITRDEFEDKLATLRQTLLQPLNDALENQFGNDAEFVNTLSQLDGIILAGGSIRVPFIQQALGELIDENKILKNVNADESAVNGVTLRGIKLFDAFKTKPLNIIERSINDYSIEYENTTGLFNETIFERGTVYPVEKSVILSSESDYSKFTFITKENAATLNNVTINNNEYFNSKSCPNGVQYNVTLSLNEIRTFSVKDVKAICLNDNVKEDVKNEPISETTVNSTATKKDTKKKLKTPVSVIFDVTDDIIEPLSYAARIKHINNIKSLDDKDKKRFQLQEAKNLLESSLYDARNFLTEEEVVTNGPETQLDELSNIVSKHLEWLEDESDDATKSQINKRRKEVELLKKKIENYLRAVGEPLDLEQFEDLLERSGDVLEKVAAQEDLRLAKLELFVETISEEPPFNYTKVYNKVKLPNHMINSLAQFNETITSLNETHIALDNLIQSKAFEKLSREELYELKESFDKVLTSAEKSDILTAVDDYKFNELKSAYHRLLRSHRRKLEKEKRKLEKENNIPVNGTIPENTTSSSESIKSSKPTKTSKVKKSSTSSSTEVVHDEL